jgi:hypothetical protein
MEGFKMMKRSDSILEDDMDAKVNFDKKNFVITRRIVEEVSPETIMKIKGEIQNKIDENNKSIEDATSENKTLVKRIASLNEVEGQAKLWVKIEEKQQERGQKNPIAQ